MRSRARLFTLTNQVLISSEPGSRGDNWLIIHDPPLRSARIDGRARRIIPHSQSVLKWDDMGFFTSKKIGGILAFALGETLSCVDSVVWGGNATRAFEMYSVFISLRDGYRDLCRHEQLTQPSMIDDVCCVQASEHSAV